MVAFKSCYLLLVDDVHGLCREPRATHGSFDGNIFGSCGDTSFKVPHRNFLNYLLRVTNYQFGGTYYQNQDRFITYTCQKDNEHQENLDQMGGMSDFSFLCTFVPGSEKSTERTFAPVELSYLGSERSNNFRFCETVVP